MKDVTEGFQVSDQAMESVPEAINVEEEQENDVSELTQQNLLAQSKFDVIYKYRKPAKKSVINKINEARKDFSCKETLYSIFPILVWLRSYQFKQNILSDIVSGFTVAILHIPQGMAYSMLGGVPPVIGIYMAFFPVLVYVLMGTSRHVSMGAFAVVCMMTGKIVLDYSESEVSDIKNNSTIESMELANMDVNDTKYTAIEVATCVCFVVGVWQLLLGVFRLGTLSVLLSETLVSGFSTGAAVHVMASQIKHVFGVKIRSFSGPLKIVYTFMEIFNNISSTNLIALAGSVITMALLAVYNDWIKPWIRKKLPIPVPVELIAVVIGTLVSMYANLKDDYNVTVVGEIPTGLPAPTLPPFSLILNILLPGLIIAIVAFSVTMSMASIFARKLSYSIDGNQELLASGVANIFASFFSCIPFAASLSRSLIQQDTGGKTQIASIISCTILLFVLLLIGPFFEPLPNCVLAGIVLVSLKGIFIQIRDIVTIWRNSKMDGLVWVVTFLGVVIIDIDIGLAIGISLSVLTVVMLGQNVKVFRFGNIPETDIYLDVSRYKASVEIPGIAILQIAGGIHFANIDSVKNKLYSVLDKRSESDEMKISYVVLDMACISFVDPVATKGLLSIQHELQEKEMVLYLATCSVTVRETLEIQGFFEEFPETRVFPFIQNAIMHIKDIIKP